MAIWQDEQHINPEAWTALMVSRNIWTGVAGVAVALGIYFSCNASTLRHEVKDLNLKLMTAQGQLSEMEYEKAKSLEMQKAGFDPDQLELCKFRELMLNSIIRHIEKNPNVLSSDDSERLENRIEKLNEFPLNMRKEARRQLGLSGKTYAI